MIDPESSSFRDPDAKVISVGNKIYRLVYQNYKQHYDKLINSGLKELLSKLDVQKNIKVFLSMTFSEHQNLVL